MIQLRSARINVAIRHCEPLLSIGIRVALQDMDAIRLIPPDDREAELPLDVLITDWDRGVTVAESDPQAASTRMRVLVISSQVREQPLKSAMRHGVHGLLLSGCSTGELHSAIFALAAGRSYVCAEVAQRMAASLSREPLTAREEEVLALLSRGRCNKSIASQLGIATGTVKSHVKAILGKLAASSRTEAASIATELGMLGATPQLPFAARRCAGAPPLESCRGHGAGLRAERLSHPAPPGTHAALFVKSACRGPSYAYSSWLDRGRSGAAFRTRLNSLQSLIPGVRRQGPAMGPRIQSPRSERPG